MQDCGKATSGKEIKPIAAFMTALLAFALAFAAPGPNALRSAFATEGETAKAGVESGREEGLQTADSSRAGNENTTEGENAAVDAANEDSPTTDDAQAYEYETRSADDDLSNAAQSITQPDETDQRSTYPENDRLPSGFSGGITGYARIVAHGQTAGMFDIVYNPTMGIEGGTVTGNIDVLLDAGYENLSPTFVMNTPKKVESTTGDDYAFSGWQVVERFDPDADVLSEQLFAEGDGFVVDSDLATNNTIHLQAVYRQTAGESDDTDATGNRTDAEGPAVLDDAIEPTATGSSNVASGGAFGEAGGSSAPTVAAASTDAGGDAAKQQESDNGTSMPQASDEAQMLTMGIAGIALLSLGIALIARAMRRNHMRDK